MDAVLRDFDNRNPQEDPVIHFYELFLKEYDAKKRMQRGVFYTPKPVVSYIVRSVHELLQTEFDLADGLADTTTWAQMAARHSGLKIPDGTAPDSPFVQILDPATGTATFLVEVIDVIHRTMTEKWKQERASKSEIHQKWNEYVPRHLLPRLYGYELMMAPYAIAHMKIGLKLFETGYRFESDERARIYLTNALEPPHDFSGVFKQMAPALAHEAEAVNSVKRHQRFTVIVGNPPYSKLSTNWNEWIDGLLHGNGEPPILQRNYYECNGAPLGERTVWIQDDYIKFTRLSQSLIDKSGVGLHGLITNNGYIDNPTLRGMRDQLTRSFSQLYVVDLHGSTKRGEVTPAGTPDENVFDIQQGVGIGIFIKTFRDCAKTVLHSDLWGDRDAKYRALASTGVSSTPFVQVATRSPHYLFVSTDSTNEDEFRAAWSVTDVFPVYHSGIITKRDSLTIHHTAEDVYRTVREFVALTPSHAKQRFQLPEDVRVWKVQWAQNDLRSSTLSRDNVIPILYRPFDTRYTYFTGRSRGFVGWPVAEMTRSMLDDDNVALVTTRMTKGEQFGHVLVSRHMVEVICLSAKTSNNAFIFPFHLHRTETKKTLLTRQSQRQCNVASDVGNAMAACCGCQYDEGDGRNGSGDVITPRDVFCYAIAVLHSGTYRDRYASFLTREYPRILAPRHIALFRDLVVRGTG